MIKPPYLALLVAIGSRLDPIAACVSITAAMAISPISPISALRGGGPGRKAVDGGAGRVFSPCPGRGRVLTVKGEGVSSMILSDAMRRRMYRGGRPNRL